MASSRPSRSRRPINYMHLNGGYESDVAPEDRHPDFPSDSDSDSDDADADAEVDPDLYCDLFVPADDTTDLVTIYPNESVSQEKQDAANPTAGSFDTKAASSVSASVVPLKRRAPVSDRVCLTSRRSKSTSNGPIPAQRNRF